MIVRVIKDWEYPNLLRQSPNQSGEWQGIQFTLEPVQDCDYVIVLNRVPEDTEINCPVDNVWAIIQEPPVKEYDWLEDGFDNFSRVITSKEQLAGDKYHFDSLALPWHINKTYDELKQLDYRTLDKHNHISWVTSSTSKRSGHQQRMQFLSEIRNRLDFDLFGRGFEPIDDKWDALGSYKYSLVIENSSANYYWTEKLSDCLLSWTMPIYYGCKNIDEYLPPEAMIKIDINRPEEAVEIIQQAINDNQWEKNLDAIAHARTLILDKYQFFPYVTQMINNHAPEQQIKSARTLTALSYNYPLSTREKLTAPLRAIRQYFS